ncbi:AcrR family transcriptional regulator [Arthrobacter globiformis]|uniref:TetR/AcrR family transcriptional regulator n=1 Tax=Arthrobacter globiformis TaxID=1665 RepID=UPI00278601AF|nr:helix-turn-helix domain-containing protein [Arthrobacter globiformis]MDQ1058615.1 AcrR family transcriptional regulator [Arthrobacter globiformis]
MTAAEVPHGISLPGRPSVATAGTVGRILGIAYDLFSRRGIRDVGVNELIESSGVAKSTFYRHFPSKDDLVLAVLALRDQIWFAEVVAEAQRVEMGPDHPLGRALRGIHGEDPRTRPGTGRGRRAGALR